MGDKETKTTNISAVEDFRSGKTANLYPDCLRVVRLYLNALMFTVCV